MFHKKRKTIKYKNRNKKNKYTQKQKKYKKTKKQKGGGENKNEKILDYINKINIDLKNKCKRYESIKNNKEKYIQYCTKTTAKVGEKTLPLCYIDSKKNEKGHNTYNCNSINEGNDYQKLDNFYTGIKQSQYTYDNENVNVSNIDKNSKNYLSNIYHLFDGYNPLILRKKIKFLEGKILNMEKGI